MKHTKSSYKRRKTYSFRLFGERVLNLVSDFLSRNPLPMNKKAESAFRNRMFDLDGPKVIDSPPLNAQNKFIVQLFQDYIELHHSVESLADSATYLRRYDRDSRLKKMGISRSRYVRYHQDKWLSEAHLLHERIRGFLTRLSRRYRTHKCLTAQLKNQVITLKDVFAAILKARGVHTHDVRNSDSAIESMETIELLGKRRRDKYWKNIAKGFFYKQAETKCYGRMAKNNKAIAIYLDALFSHINRNIFDTKGTIVWPRKGP